MTNFHKLLQKQAKKHLTDQQLNEPAIQNLLMTVSDSYVSFERDKELLNHAFGISETEYQKLYEDLNKEYDLKRVSIERLKDAVKELDQKNEVIFNRDKDELLVIVDYLKTQIVKRKETESDLSRTLQLLTTLLSNLNSGILVEDEHRRIVVTNQLFCDTFSIRAKPEQMIGADCSDSAEQTKHLFKNPEVFASKINEILQNKVAVFADELELKDGRIIERDYIPIYIENEYKGHLWDYTDVTEQKYFEKRLIDLTNMQNAILNGTDYSIIYTDITGTIKAFNFGAEKMLGYKAEEIVGIHTPAIIHDIEEVIKKSYELSIELGYEIKPGFEVFVEKSKTGLTETNEWTYIKKNGERLSVLLTVSCIRDASLEIIGFLGIARNITEQKQINEALKYTEERYRNIVEKSTDIIYKTNKYGNFIYVNPVAERITEYSQDELINKNFSTLIKEENRESAAIFYLDQVKQKKSTTYYEFPIITKSGKEIWLAQSVQLSELSAKDFEFTALAIDITEKKTYELQLIETNKKLELLQTLINNTSDAIQVAKENGQIVYINYEASKNLGIVMNETSNYYVRDIEKLFSDDNEWHKHVAEVKSKGTLILEGENINKQTNKTCPVEVTVRFVEIDSVGYIIANSRDITERKLIEESIVKQKEKYQNIITNMNLGLLEVDLEEKIQFVNPGFTVISGYQQEELIGQNAAELFISDSHVNIVKGKIKERSKGLSDMYEIPAKNKKGELRWWMISGAPNYDNKGNIIGSIGIHLDITEQKQLELELELAKSKAEESSKAKETFLANMSHEIRTPLNAIIGMIRELSKEKLSDKQTQYVHNTSVASQHLLSVLNNILDISKIEAGELQLDSHHFNLASLLNDVKSIMIAKASEKELYLKINHPPEKNSFFIGDSSRFRQIFLNLIGNAVKFTHAGGITVNYDVQNLHKGFQAIVISITDTGVGMEESYLKNIFSKFSQEDSSISRKYGGSGLGMSITRELIHLMNGSITIESKKNIGTTIHIKLLLPIGDGTKIENNKTIDSSNKLNNTNVLLVEDNEYNRAVASNTLNYFNCKIIEAQNGQEAIEILRSGKTVDIILMDLQMPIMNGFETTEHIRNILKLNVPIIALTANAFKSELEQCIKTGMNDYVTKPFEEERLIAVMNKWLSSSIDNSFINKVNNDIDIKDQTLYNLSKLISLSRNDKVYVQKMIQIFVDQTLISIYQMKEAYAIKDLDTLYKIVHKIKPSIDGMGIEILREDIREIEKLALEGIDSEELEKKLLFLFSVLSKVVEQLQHKNI